MHIRNQTWWKRQRNKATNTCVAKIGTKSLRGKSPPARVISIKATCAYTSKPKDDRPWVERHVLHGKEAAPAAGTAAPCGPADSAAACRGPQLGAGRAPGGRSSDKSIHGQGQGGKGPKRRAVPGVLMMVGNKTSSKRRVQLHPTYLAQVPVPGLDAER